MSKVTTANAGQESQKLKVNSRSGFSLIEIVLYSIILGMVIMLFSGIMTSIAKISARQNSLVEINYQLNFAHQTIQRLIKDGQPISIPASGGFANQLSFQDQNGNNLVIRINETNQIVLCTNNDCNRPLTSSTVTVNTLNFTNNNKIIKINIGINDKLLNKSIESVVLSN